MENMQSIRSRNDHHVLQSYLMEIFEISHTAYYDHNYFSKSFAVAPTPSHRLFQHLYHSHSSSITHCFLKMCCFIERNQVSPPPRLRKALYHRNLPPVKIWRSHEFEFCWFRLSFSHARYHTEWIWIQKRRDLHGISQHISILIWTS